MQACAKCGESFEVEDLNITADGELCDVCMCDADSVDESRGALASIRPILIMSGVAALAGTLISLRSTSTYSASFMGHGSRTVRVSADFGGFILCGLALIAVLAGLLKLSQAKAFDEESKKSMRKKKLIMMSILICIGLWSAFRIYQSLPSNTTVRF